MKRVPGGHPCTPCVNNRCIDSSALKKGLTTLGIGVSTEVSKALVLKLGGERATAFSISDLSTFTHHGIGGSDCQAYKSERSERGERSCGETRAQNESIPRCDLRSLAVDGPARKTQKPRLAVDAEQRSKRSDHLRKGDVANWQGKTQIATPQRDDQNSACVPPLNLFGTVDATTTAALPSSNQMDISEIPKKHRWDDLPCWARQASRNALGELMGHHKR